MDICIKCSKSDWNLKLTVPGDKSIGHRSLIIGTIPEGCYKIENFSFSEDCMSTRHAIEKLGVKIMESIENENRVLYVESPGYLNYKKDVGLLNCGNSGTTVRLISGLLCGAKVQAELTGDDSLKKRPMKRIIEPLKLMNGLIKSKDEKLPLQIIRNEGLKGIIYDMPVASAQVKSAILIAGFLGEGTTVVNEKYATRNHTENMFKYLGADITVNKNKITIKNSNIRCKDIFVPGDPSSAAFLIAATILSENSELTLENVLLNSGRIKYIDILKRMGANINIHEKGYVNEEPVGNIQIKSSKLNGAVIKRNEVPSLIDEIPVLSVLAAFANKKTIFKNVEELKYKECDRIEAIIKNLKKFNVNATIDEDYNLTINPVKSEISKDIIIDSYNDHRIALAFLVCAMKNKGKTIIKDYNCTDISFPKSLDYFKDIINIEKL